VFNVVESEAMKVQLTVKDIAEARGFKNAKQLADAAGIHYKSMYTIWSGDAQLISMDVLGRLCTTLRVQPGMLFEQIQEAEPLPPSEQSTSAKPAKASGSGQSQGENRSRRGRL
jgi:DNA-binding Xre family transcriptional regulator